MTADDFCDCCPSLSIPPHYTTFTRPASLWPSLETSPSYSVPNSARGVCFPSYRQSVNTSSSYPAIDVVSPLQSSRCTHANLAFDTTTPTGPLEQVFQLWKHCLTYTDNLLRAVLHSALGLAGALLAVQNCHCTVMTATTLFFLQLQLHPNITVHLYLSLFLYLCHPGAFSGNIGRY